MSKEITYEEGQLDYEKIKGLNSDLELYNISIEDDPKNANAHYMKATTLVKLAHETKDPSLSVQAIEAFNKALELTSNKNSLYLVERSKLHVEMGNPALAVEDIKLVSGLPEVKGVAGIYTRNTIRDITKLGEIQKSIDDLLASRKIDEELATILREHVNVTSGLVVQVGVHSDKLENHDERIKKLENLVRDLKNLTGKLTEDKKISDTQIAELKKEYVELKLEQIENTKKIQGIEAQLITFVDKEDFEIFAFHTNNADKVIGKEIEILKVNIEGHEKLIAHIDDTLIRARVVDKVEIQEKFQDLETLYGKEVYDYALTFYKSLSSSLLAYRMIETGLIQEKLGNNSKLIEAISDGVVKVIGKIFESIPIVGGVVSVMNTMLNIVYQTYTKGKFDQVVKKVNESFGQVINPDDLDIAIAISAIRIATMKSAIIKGNAPEEGELSKAKEWLSTKLDQTLSKFTGIQGVATSPASKLALKDVTLFIGSIATSDTKLVASNQEAGVLEQEIVKLFESDVINKQLVEVFNKNTAKSPLKIFMLNKISYDNELLNHYKLLEDAVEFFGFNKALNLSQGLSPDLIMQAIENKDPTIILGGLMSLADANSE